MADRTRGAFAQTVLTLLISISLAACGSGSGASDQPEAQDPAPSKFEQADGVPSDDGSADVGSGRRESAGSEAWGCFSFDNSDGWYISTLDDSDGPTLGADDLGFTTVASFVDERDYSTYLTVMRFDDPEEWGTDYIGITLSSFTGSGSVRSDFTTEDGTRVYMAYSMVEDDYGPYCSLAAVEADESGAWFVYATSFSREAFVDAASRVKVDGGRSSLADRIAADAAEGEAGTAPVASGTWGCFSFDNSDGRYIELDEELLAQLVGYVESFDALGGSAVAGYVESEGLTSQCIIFRFDGTVEWDEELILSVIESFSGNDIHSEFVTDSGSKVYTAYASTATECMALAIEPDADGAWLILAGSDSSEAFFGDVAPRIRIDAGRKAESSSLADYFSTSEDTMRVGSAENGWVSIPASWVAFADLDDSVASDPHIIQYSDNLGTILTLNYFTCADVGVDDAHDLAYGYTVALLDSYDANGQVLESAAMECSIGGSPAYLINSKWSDGTWMFTFLIEGTDRVYYIACEGYPENATELAYMVQGTFSTER